MIKLDISGASGASAVQLTLDEAADRVLQAVESLPGCTASIHASEGQSTRVTVNHGRPEERRYASTRGLSLNLYQDGRRSQASSTDLSWPALQLLLQQARESVGYAEQDTCNGLPDAALQTPIDKDLQLYHPASWTLADATDLALAMEAEGLASDQAITHSQGVSVSGGEGRSLIAMSNGFRHQYRHSGYSLNCDLIASRDGQREVDGWSIFGRGPDVFEQASAVAVKAAERVLRKLGARPIKTQRCAVLFEAPVAHSLLQHLVSCISGHSLYTGNSFLVDALGREILPATISIIEDPLRPGDMATRPCDGDGIAASPRHIVSNGCLETYFLGLYSARRLSMRPTGNGYGPSHLAVHDSRTSASDDFTAMVRHLDRGLVVTGLGGRGFNALTGEYSRSASGLWVEQGEIVHAVQNLTVAGTLQQMLAGLQRVGADVLDSYGTSSGSWLLQEMTVGGN
ncbi:TldD/PmbA family protein [Frateuria aurantia]